MSTSAASCGCCSGIANHTPMVVENRPGLTAIAYRVGTHRTFLKSMLAGLSDASRPALAALGTRDPDDFSIALLDAWAVASDVLTFYSERRAQEGYLRTAAERISLQELGRLVGYQLRPGVAAETSVAFAIEPPPVATAGTANEPGSAPPVVPGVVTLGTGLRIQSIPGPGEEPQVFETIEEIEARPEWNAIPASRTEPLVLDSQSTSAYLRGSALNLKPGDGFLLTSDIPHEIEGERWDLRVLTSVVADPREDRTRVDWDVALGSIAPPALPAAAPKAYAFRKRINVFGYNAPLWRSMSDDFRSDYAGADDQHRADWPGFSISGGGANTVDLDGSHPDVVVGSWVVLSRPGYRELWRVAGVEELSRAEFAVSGKVTRIALSGGENYEFFESPRRTIVFAVSEPLELAERPDESHVSGDAIAVDVDVSAMTPGRRLLVRGRTASGGDHAEDVVVSAAKALSGGWLLELEDGLAESYERGTVVVHGNVAAANHGETVEQLLGSGRASASFQRFPLAHAPLTYTQSTDPSGADAALEVRVNDVRWEEVTTLYGAGHRDRAYVVRTDERGIRYVQFGDGRRGVRLPSGTNNVRARYRKGLGMGGNVGAGTLTQLLDRPLGLKGVSNPLPAKGGADPQSEAAGRTSIPLGMRTLGRAVSLLDYEDFARAFAGVTKAHAAVLPLRGRRAIVVTVAFAGVAEGDPRLDDLGTALRAHGDPRVDVVVLSCVEQNFRLALKVKVDPSREVEAVLADVEATLRASYSFDARALTEPVHRSDVLASVHSVAGVVGVDLDRLYAGWPSLVTRLLARRPAIDAAGGPTPAGVLVMHPDPVDWIEAMP
jgi:hypothetical protein